MARHELRALNQPRPVRVGLGPDGQPAAIGDGRRWVPVAQTLDRWRVDDQWWRKPVSRMYHELLLADGRIRTVYHDLVKGGWFAQRG